MIWESQSWTFCKKFNFFWKDHLKKNLNFSRILVVFSLFLENPNIGKLSSMYMYAWKQGIKTTYYLRSRAKTAIQKTTVNTTEEPKATAEEAVVCSLENPESCEACQWED